MKMCERTDGETLVTDLDFAYSNEQIKLDENTKN